MSETRFWRAAEVFFVAFVVVWVILRFASGEDTSDYSAYCMIFAIYAHLRATRTERDDDG